MSNICKHTTGNDDQLINSITEYLENKNEREKYTFRFQNGSGYYFKGNLHLSEDEMNAMFPIPQSFLSRKNVDPTRNWMQ